MAGSNYDAPDGLPPNVVTSAGIGQGREFLVRLPIMVETAAVPAPAMTREPALTAKGLRILIVDDNRDAAGMLAMQRIATSACCATM